MKEVAVETEEITAEAEETGDNLKMWQFENLKMMKPSFADFQTS